MKGWISWFLDGISLVCLGLTGSAAAGFTPKFVAWAGVLGIATAKMANSPFLRGGNGGPPAASLALLAVFLALPTVSCAHTQPVVSGVIKCSEAGIHESALNLLDDVASALATGDYMSALLDLVGRFGEGAIDCAAREVMGSSRRNAQINGDQIENSKAQRAQAWLASRPVTLE